MTHTELIPMDEPMPEQASEEEEATEKPVILLVEDNEDILEMLKEIFRPIYEVHTAHNGLEGFEQSRTLQPDIVLSDVMMPGMSGKEMCYKIKNHVDMSHIPVVLLTAQTSVEYAIEGYMYGADDYITKPFNIKLLISRCNNLVKSRKALIEKFRNRQELSAPGNAVTQAEQEMNEFTLKLKLDESTRLLTNHPELNISEISDQLGFSSTPYFSKCFKSVFGVSPQTYRKSSTTA